MISDTIIMRNIECFRNIFYYIHTKAKLRNLYHANRRRFKKTINIVLKIIGGQSTGKEIVMAKEVAVITAEVIKTLSLSCPINTPIYIGESNINHMKDKHLDAYQKYFSYIGTILTSPHYVGINTKDESIEYVREFKIDHEYVKVAVRVSLSGKYFARSFVLI